MNRALRCLLCCGRTASNSGTLSCPQGSHAPRTRKANRTKSRACASMSTPARRMGRVRANSNGVNDGTAVRPVAERSQCAVRHSELVAFSQVGAHSPDGTVAVFVCARTCVQGGRGSPVVRPHEGSKSACLHQWHGTQWLPPCRQSLDAMRATVLRATRSAHCPSWPERRGRGC